MNIVDQGTHMFQDAGNTTVPQLSDEKVESPLSRPTLTNKHKGVNKFYDQRCRTK